MPRAQINDVGNTNNSPLEWFQELPIVTKYWFGATIVLTIGGNLGFLSPMHFILSWEDIRDRFEIWRLVTNFCYAGSFEFATLIIIYTLYSFSKNYETSGGFNTGSGGGTADYIFMWLFGAIMMMATHPVIKMVIPVGGRIFCRNMVYYVVYIWSKRYPTSDVAIWGIPIKAIYLPFVHAALNLFIGAPYMYIIHGIAIGHVYYFLADVVPQVYGKEIMSTPKFLIDQFGVGTYTPPAATGTAPAAAAAERHSWGGGGQRLGATGGTAAAPARVGGGGGAGGGAGGNTPQKHSWGSGAKLGS